MSRETRKSRESSSSPESRSTKDILKDLCTYTVSSADPGDRLPHDCYMIMVGHLKSQEHMKMLLDMSESQGISSTKEGDEDQAEYAVLKSENVESILEHIKLTGKTEQLESQRKSHFVYEDNFNSSLTTMMETRSSFEKLKKVCRIYEHREGVNVDKVMAEHENRANASHSYFCERKVPPDEAKALAFSIAFYTGSKSEACNRGASLIARKSNGQVLEGDVENEINEAAIILYYLVKALSYIPFYWGYVTRACQLTYDELKLYVPGALITWIQFSSSKKGKKAVNSKAFKDRNVLFKIFSLTGRPIKHFSNYPEEDEILFLPHSTFLVFNHKTYYKERKQVIYMRQVELGLCTWSVLWVDDRIFDENWENKQHMEYAAINALDINVHFIPKSSTDSALSFLRSAFGQRLKNQDTFRIVTDMNRTNEKPAHNAGARLIKAIRQMGFKFLEHAHQPPWAVLAGYLSPTHDSYVHSKLGDPAWIPAADRCRLCEKAIEYEGSAVSSWIGVSRGESEWVNGFVDFGPVTEYLRDFLNSTLVDQNKILKYPLRVIRTYFTKDEQLNISQLICLLSHISDIFVSWSIGFVILACTIHLVTIVNSKCFPQPTRYEYLDLYY
ncbi:unnamed protein product [Rotaria sp. Silwood1]|nr:unnamed protein product [Rotaria sp. Silwood1]CAF3523695.1 unnamed protein product [Rotaria sp. Silwood1]CAF3535733.1 unnamed protein product [Rotaria sp. Silwood1]CAF4655287.1 unnamed protein product [Rotaria sp. Silwood1]CAF4670402.1 unnamed protein product [Rotaria sp. Silwood1]